MKYALTTNELELEFQADNFVLKTQQQIAKDFATVGVDFNATFHSTPLTTNEILDAVGFGLEQLMKQGERVVLQLLYQIDVPQKDFLSLVNKPTLLEDLSFLILRREAYKVYLRSKF